jgi:type I restriction enzyme M protein
MRRSNCAGALQYAPELTWILFLRILDEREDFVNNDLISHLKGLKDKPNATRRQKVLSEIFAGVERTRRNLLDILA